MLANLRSAPLVIGVTLRLVLVFLLFPDIQKNLFLPFLINTIKDPRIDIWQSWIDSGGRLDAFPYGLAMLLPLLAGAFVASLFSMDLLVSSSIVLGLILVATDGTILRSLVTTGSNKASAQWLYALSPLAIYISFVHGQLDAIPTAYFVLAFLFIERRNWGVAGVLLALSISAKLSFLIVLPFFLVFFFDNPRYRGGLRVLIKYFLIVFTATQLPLLLLSGYREMVISTPEIQRILTYAVSISGEAKILIFPAVYVSLLYWLWKIGRSTTGVLFTFTGAALLAVAISAPEAIGWFAWSLPILSLLASKRETVYSLLFVWIQVSILIAFFGKQSGSEWRVDDLAQIDLFGLAPSIQVRNIFETSMFVFGAILVVSILRQAISLGDVYGISKSPLSIAIAGDSGVGKDTISESLAKTLGAENTVFLLGDDYHLYERGDSMWNTMTHLNPKANNLALMNKDLINAVKRFPVRSRHYDHAIGRFTKPRLIEPADFVIINGLHSLHLSASQELVDLKVFLEMEEGLRRDLKVKRDTTTRSTNARKVVANIESRLEDSKNYIQPQRSKADTVIRVERIQNNVSELDLNDIRLKVEATLFSLGFGNELTRLLRSVTNAHVKEFQHPENGLIITIDPTELTASDYSLLCSLMLPEERQIFMEKPIFNDGAVGLISLIIVLSLAARRAQKVGA